MKAISLHQPWASLIGMGLKRYETRHWATKYRGELLICSAKKRTFEQSQIYEKMKRNHFPDAEPWGSSTKLASIYVLPFGRAIALVHLTDCIKMDEELIQAQSQLEIDCGLWEVGRYAWKLENIRKIISPPQIKGAQGLFNLDIKFNDEDLEYVA